jgi:phosphate transport system substrate-binding protein
MKKIILLASLLITFGLVSCGETTSESGTTTSSFDQSSLIKVYTRDTTSGTREAFFKGIDFGDAVKDNSQLVDGYIEVDGNGSMISSVNGDEYGMGYISLSSLNESGLNGLSFEGVQASEENVLNDTYGLKRPFMYVTRDDWTGKDTERQIVEAFVAYMSTVDGKATIQNGSGIVQIHSEDQSWDDIKGNYDVCTLDNSAVTIHFGGSTSVENIAKALSAEFSPKCGNFIAEHNHTGSGDAFKRTQGEESDGANQLDIGFASRPFDTDETVADGTYGQICWDAVVVVVNGDNDLIANITADEVKRIYAGEISTWNDLLS